MPVIGAKVSADIKAKFDVIAATRGTTSSRLARRLISEFIEQEIGRTETTDQLGMSVPPGTRFAAKSEQVFVRLEPFNFAELGRLAAERLWHRGTYLGNLFRAHLDLQPALCNSEIDALRQVARQLADMGRNINQIARKANISPDYAHLVSLIDFELVKMLIDLETKAVKDLLQANLRGWGVGNAEA